MRKILESQNKSQGDTQLRPKGITDHILYHQAFDKSIQASIISTVSNGKIIIVNNAACKLLGYSKKEFLTKRRAAIFDIDDNSFKLMLQQEMPEGQSTDLVTVLKKGGKSLPCEITSRVFEGEDGIKKAITSITKVSLTLPDIRSIDPKKNKVLGKDIIPAPTKSDVRLAESIEWKKHSGKTSYDVMWQWDIATGKIYVGDSIEEVFGYKVRHNTVKFIDFMRKLIPDEKSAVKEKIAKALASGSSTWNDSFKFKRDDGTVAFTTCRASIIRDEDANAIRMIGAIQDISRLQELKMELELEIGLKGKQIAEAAKDAKEMERSDLGKELHDNVNQLLGVSKLCLDLAKEGGEDAKMFLSRSSEYTITAIEEIRKLTKGLTTGIGKNLGLCEAIVGVSIDTMEVNTVNICTVLESFNEQSVGDKFKLNVFRIVQEQLNNILKHAKATEVIISLVQNNQSIILSIKDNGVGFDNSKQRNGIGIANILSRARAYKGYAEFISQPGRGCLLKIIFPLSDVLL